MSDEDQASGGEVKSGGFTAISINARLDKCFEKIGTLDIVRCFTTKRQANADRHARLLEAQTDNDVRDVIEGRKAYTEDGALVPVADKRASEPLVVLDDGRIEPRLLMQALGEGTAERMRNQDVQEQINLTKASLVASEHLQSRMGEGVAEEVDPDWFVRWRDSAKKVQAEELQKLWGRILAGEIIHPGSWSLRTLDFIRNLTRSEAVTISKLAPFIINNCIIDNSEVFNRDLYFGGYSADIPEMIDLGIISSSRVPFAVYIYTEENSNLADGVIYTADKIIHLSPPRYRTLDDWGDVSDTTSEIDNGKATNNIIAKWEKIDIPNYALTQTGCEILSLLKTKSNPEYIKEVAHKWKANGVDVKVADYSIDAEGNKIVSEFSIL